MPLPNWKLAMVFAQALRKHGHKVLHAKNIDLLTKDLGLALKEQQRTLEDPEKGTLQTIYDVLPQIAEVKVFMTVVTHKLDISTKGKAPFDILQEIIDKTEKRGSHSAKEIKDSMEWSQKFFAHPEIRAIFEDDSIEIKKPESIKDLGKTAKQIGGKAKQEIQKIHRFLKAAKNKKPKDQ